MRKFWLILKKEFIDCIRDRRSIAMMILPVLVFPVIMSFSNQQMKAADEDLAVKLTLATNDETAISDVVNYLTSNNLDVNVVDAQGSSNDLKSGKVLLILDKDDAGYHILYDQSSVKSTKALGIVTAAIESQKLATIHAIFNLHGENVDILNQYNYTFQDATTGEQENAQLLSVLGPMMLVMFIATGGTGVALDLFCGEKERGSLEAVLSTQVNRKSLYFAKVATVLIFGCFSALISILSYLLSFVLTDDLNNGAMPLMNTGQIFLLIVVAGVFAFFTSTVISVLSVGAKTVREGSLRTGMFAMIPSMVGGISMYLETGNAPVATSMVPIINVIGVLKSIFVNVVSLEQAVITIASTIVYGVIFLYIGQKIMDSESVLRK